jgi:hypothetical protein
LQSHLLPRISIVAVPVMDIGVVRMRMHHRLVSMRVGVGLPRRVVWPVRVLVMQVVYMQVGM